jgi:hypothetical protein
VKVATVGNPATETEKLDIPSIPEFIEMIADTGAGLHACKESVDMFAEPSTTPSRKSKNIIAVGEFCELAAGGQIIFT